MEDDLTAKEETNPKETPEQTSENEFPVPSREGVDESKAGSKKTDLGKIEHIQGLALALFDRTKPLHDLGGDSRLVMENAVVLYNITPPQTKKKPYKKAKKFLRAYLPKDFKTEQIEVLAAVLALQQGKIKRKDVLNLNLSPIQHREVLTIAALLLIAIGLDCSQSQGTSIEHIEASRNKIWVVVNGPEASADAAEAQQESSMWAAIGYPRMKIMLPEKAETKAIPYPEPMERPGLEPSDPLSEAGRKVMRYQFAEMLRHEKGTRLGEDVESLHDMRVATRRLRAAFEVFNYAFKPGALKSHLKGLRRTGRALGKVRDLDVFVEKAQRYLKSLPEERQDELDPLMGTLQEHRDSARAELLDYFDNESYFDFKRSFNIFIKTRNAGARKVAKEAPNPHTVRELAPVLIYQRLASVRSFDPYLEDASIERLHALRIEFKKLRYTVEYFREVLGGEAEAVIEDLKKMQDHLGDLNDAYIASLVLGQFIERHEASQSKLPKSERARLIGVEAYLQARQEELVRLRSTFPQSWAFFNRPELVENLANAVSNL